MSKPEHAATKWDTYLNAPISENCPRQAQCREAFDDSRACIAALVREMRPARVACLGSGLLNDIPLEALFHAAEETCFVDWIPDVSSEGLKQQIIQESPQALCRLCDCPHPDRYCLSFSGKESPDSTVCRSFVPIRTEPVRCTNYTPGPEPHFVQADVTSGRASYFGRRMEKVIAWSDSPKQAFQRAIRESRNCANRNDTIPIESDHFDFVTSSLVASQFAAEPYGFFAQLLEEKFGREAVLAKQHVLAPLMEDLHKELFRVQIEGHAAEIYRLLNKERGKAYLSVEFFRSLPAKDDFFLVHEIPQLLEALSRYFFFDFDSLPPKEAVRSHPMGNGTSIVQGFVLTPKPATEFAVA